MLSEPAAMSASVDARKRAALEKSRIRKANEAKRSATPVDVARENSVEASAARAVALYKAGDHAAAIDAFTAALALETSGRRATLYKNRAAARAALEQWEGCEADLTLALAEAGRAVASRILLKRCFARGKLERHEDALEDATAAAAAASTPTERTAAEAQAARCRVAVRQDAAELKASAAEGQSMVHESQTLRLFFASPIPARVRRGDRFDVEVRVANEFGLWRPRDWASAAATDRCELVVDGRGIVPPDDVFIGRDAKATLTVTVDADDGADVVLRVAVDASAWLRPPIAVLSLPVRVGATATEDRFGAVGATCCREVAVGPGDRVVVSEAAGALGIGGKLWDASFALLAYVRCGAVDGRLAGKRCLELGSGVGAVGIGAARHAASVALSDVPDVVPLLEANATLNDAPNVDALALDWFEPLPAAIAGRPFDVVLASDVVYDPELHAPLLKTLAALLDGCGVPLCLLAHRHRNPHDDLFFAALFASFDVVENFLPEDARAGCPPDVRLFSVRPQPR